MSSSADFDFLFGAWQVRHQRLKDRLCGCTVWQTFDGESTTRPILGGHGNIEDNVLALPAGEYRAAALRAFDPVRAQWSIWWLDGRNPTGLDTPVVGRFEHGVGTFLAEDRFEDQPIIVRFLWSQISADSCRWEQAFSADRGATWETNWTMAFSRRSP